MPERPADIELPAGWDWDRVESQRRRWDISDDMVPVVVVPGAAVAWGTINSVRENQAWDDWVEKVESQSGRNILNIERAFIAFHNGQTASDYALEVVARAGEFL